jgi:thiol peroxidase
MQGNPLTLSGDELKVGSKAPDFEVTDLALKPVKFSSFKGKPCLIFSVPSLDTSVCNKETHKVNQEIAKFGNQVTVLTISMDLPFAQKRWCGAEGALNLQTLSDYKTAEFGQKYGVLIKELRLLARAVFLIDTDGILRYQHIVKEISHEPPYEEIFNQLTSLMSGAK